MLLGCGGAPHVSSSPSEQSVRPASPQQRNAGELDRAQALADASVAAASVAIAAAMRGTALPAPQIAISTATPSRRSHFSASRRR
jgi:hypothetical protein